MSRLSWQALGEGGPAAGRGEVVVSCPDFAPSEFRVRLKAAAGGKTAVLSPARARYLGRRGAWSAPCRLPEGVWQQLEGELVAVGGTRGPGHAWELLGLLNAEATALTPGALEAAFDQGPEGPVWARPAALWSRWTSGARQALEVLQAVGARDLTLAAANERLARPYPSARFTGVLEAMETEMLRPHGPRAAFLFGPSGSGKTTAVAAFAHALVTGDVHWALRSMVLLQIPAGAFLATDDISTRLAGKPAIVFVDEAHQLKVASQRGVNPALERLRALVDAGVPLVLSSNREEILLKEDEALERRLTLVAVPPAGKEETCEILGRRLAGSGLEADGSLAARAYRLSSASGFCQPDAGLKLLSRAQAMARREGNDAQAQGLLDAAFAAEFKRPPQPRDAAEWLSLLSGKYLGQGPALRRVSETLAAAALREARLVECGRVDEVAPTPLLFVGPVGCGKSAVAKTIGEALGNTDEYVWTWHGGDFRERHTALKLTGSPPSFVGWDESGEMLRALSKGARVLVLDEVSLFHPSALLVVERLLDEGVLVGGNGQKERFNGFVLFTDNGDFEGARRIGFGGSRKSDLIAHLSRSIGRRLLSRVGAASVVPFARVEAPEVRRGILRLHLARLAEQMAVEARADEAALELLASEATVSLGARDLIRVFRQRVEPQLLAALAEMPYAIAVGVFAEDGEVRCRAFAPEEVEDAGEPSA